MLFLWPLFRLAVGQINRDHCSAGGIFTDFHFPALGGNKATDNRQSKTEAPGTGINPASELLE